MIKKNVAQAWASVRINSPSPMCKIAAFSLKQCSWHSIFYTQKLIPLSCILYNERTNNWKTWSSNVQAPEPTSEPFEEEKGCKTDWDTGGAPKARRERPMPPRSDASVAEDTNWRHPPAAPGGRSTTPDVGAAGTGGRTSCHSTHHWAPSSTKTLPSTSSCSCGPCVAPSLDRAAAPRLPFSSHVC